MLLMALSVSLLIETCQDKIVLWNPSTFLLAQSLEEEGFHLLHGFVYDHVNYDYKVLQLIHLKGQNSWDIYSLKNNSRTTFELNILFFPLFPCVDVYVNGMCHWFYCLGEGYVWCH